MPTLSLRGTPGLGGTDQTGTTSYSDPARASANNPAAATDTSTTGSTPGLGGTALAGPNNGAADTGAYSASNPANINPVAGLMNPTSTGGGAYNNGSALPFNPVNGLLQPTLPQTNTTTPAANAGPAIYGTQGNQTLSDWQNEQANTFNANQQNAAGQYNTALGQMPYNTSGNLANPYNQYLANPATPGQASAAFQSPDNTAAWQQSGLAGQLSPTALGQTNNSSFSNPGAQQNQNYVNGQLNFLQQALRLYGQGGQNQFGNGFSPILAGGSGQQTSPQSSGSNSLGLAQILPLLMALGQRQNGPANGSYGNLGTNFIMPQNNYTVS